jgi:predicted metal-dependent enzyme (double-stranded beta helix superfamily)
MREVTVFSLASHMVWCLWGLKQGQTSSIPFAYYHFARDKLEDYREAKARAETLLLEAEVVSS